MRWLARRLLRLYPRGWRARYESEVAAVLEEHPVTLRTLADLVAGALDARLEADYRTREETMPTTTGGKPSRRYTRCSFCGKGQDQVKRLIAGPGVYICDACVELCNEVLANPPGPRPNPTPAPPVSPERLSLWMRLRNLFRIARLSSSPR